MLEVTGIFFTHVTGSRVISEVPIVVEDRVFLSVVSSERENHTMIMPEELEVNGSFWLFEYLTYPHPSQELNWQPSFPAVWLA